MENFDYLPKLHNCQLIIAREIKRLCDKHNIKYFIIAGTLLGAVRHGGFIPWDDDMDIGMLREDYEKFLEIAKSELGEDFFLQTPETDKNYGLPFAKILLNGTILVEATAGSDAKKGIFIDVFPFDVAPENEADRENHNKQTYFYKRLLLAKLNYNVCAKNDYVKRAVYFALKVMATFYFHDKLVKKLESEITKYNDKKTEDIVNIGGAYGYKKETIKADWVRDTVEIPFEDMTISAPVDYIKYLETFYGDYMTPPPEDKRYNRHSVTELDFGKYAD
ncbi:MAG: LicD family protein [Clostridia bacterium]|nr:LicD family protein [Clostridia bacterium]